MRMWSGSARAELGLDRVRRHLPDAVEPVDEHLHLGPPGRVGRVERRVGEAALEVLDDPGRVGDAEAVVVEHRHQVLAARVADGRPVGRVAHDDLGGDPLVAEREPHPLDVRRVRDRVEAQAPAHTVMSSRKWASSSNGPTTPEVQPLVADHLAREPLDVGGRHGLDSLEHLLGLGQAVLEHLAAQAEGEQAARVLELEHHAPLEVVLRPPQLDLVHRLAHELPELAHDRLHGQVDALDVDAGLREQRPRVVVGLVVAEDVVGQPQPLTHLGEET